MPLCTRCGAILYEDDVNTHQCKLVPVKGQEILPASSPTEIRKDID